MFHTTGLNEVCLHYFVNESSVTVSANNVGDLEQLSQLHWFLVSMYHMSQPRKAATVMQ